MRRNEGMRKNKRKEQEVRRGRSLPASPEAGGVSRALHEDPGGRSHIPAAPDSFHSLNTSRHTHTHTHTPIMLR